VAKDGVLPGFWCYEAGQAGFGDTLEWFMRTFASGEAAETAFARYTELAARLRPGENRLVALDWWNGCRVPHGDTSLSGLLVGMNLKTSPVDIYRALLESLCFGTRRILECFVDAGVPVKRVVLTSGLAQRNRLLMQLMADVLNRCVEVPQIHHATALSAAIHGAVAAGVVTDFAAGAARYGAQSVETYAPNPQHADSYLGLYQKYKELSGSDVILNTMHGLQ
jgi:L-ribulokinase